MMANQTANGNMTGASPTNDTSANESGRISDMVSVIDSETETPITTCDDGC
ncbi:MAG TPA: hypothetical protein VE130_05735 [Nitrososphaeraceae archaeon]|nr:hypothetical protein [Nitrososphaeraceae archaeon]